MTASQKLEAFLEMAKDRNETTIEAAKFHIEENRDEETKELESVDLIPKDITFYCTDLITLAEAMGLSCYVGTGLDGKFYVRVY